MARITSIIQFTGRAGSLVGSKGKNGKITLRQYQPTIANPRTDAQMRQRAKIKLAAQVAGMLGQVGQTALIANGYRRTERGKLIKMLLNHVVVNQDGSQATLAYGMQLVDSPSYAEAISMQIASSSNRFTATFSGASAGRTIAKSIMVHDLTTGLWRHTSALDTNTALSIAKSANESGHALEVFAYGIALLPKVLVAPGTISGTSANEEGFLVDLSRVSTTTFDFSPTISAAMSVAGNGTTTGGDSPNLPATPGGGSTSGSGSQSSTNVTITATANDSAMGSVTGGGTVAKGSTVTLTATPNEGYVFSRWSNGETSRTITFTANADASYVATFGTSGGQMGDD
ncbi:MAG: hypothetical protein Q4D03_04155 [Bacteroidales bacterium]|nr:hypothetical protein [Bacteroidales bacterium]